MQSLSAKARSSPQPQDSPFPTPASRQPGFPADEGSTPLFPISSMKLALWRLSSFLSSSSVSDNGLGLLLECRARWPCSNTRFNRSLSRVRTNEVTPNSVSSNSHSTCSLGHAAVRRGPGLESRDTTRCQDNQHSTVIETWGTLRGGADDSPTDHFNSADQPPPASLSHVTSGSNYPLLPQGYCSFVLLGFFSF